MTPEDLAAVADKPRKLQWLECVHSTFIEAGSKADTELRKEFKETRRLEKLVREAAKKD